MSTLQGKRDTSRRADKLRDTIAATTSMLAVGFVAFKGVEFIANKLQGKGQGKEKQQTDHDEPARTEDVSSTSTTTSDFWTPPTGLALPPTRGPARPKLCLTIDLKQEQLQLELKSCSNAMHIEVGRVNMNSVDIVIPDNSVSARHFAIDYNGSKWVAYDLGSLNGTTVGTGRFLKSQNREPTRPTIVAKNQQISLAEGSGPKIPTVTTGNLEFSSPRTILPCEWAAAQGPSRLHEQQDVVLTEMPLGESSMLSLFGVFDGHCDALAAKEARRLVSSLLVQILSRRLGGTHKSNLRNLTDKVAQESLSNALQEAEEELHFDYSGATATVVLVWKKGQSARTRGVCANVGDSHCICLTPCRSQQRSLSAKLLTEDHRVASEKETARLTEEGACIHDWGTRVQGINIARTLGDKRIKRECKSILSTPFVSEVVEASKEGLILVIASDGIWDVYSPEDVCSGIKDNKTVERMAFEIVRSAVLKPNADDCTAVVVRVGGA